MIRGDFIGMVSGRQHFLRIATSRAFDRLMGVHAEQTLWVCTQFQPAQVGYIAVFLGENIGDILIINDTGAYGKVMASMYNSRNLPSEFLVNKDKFATIYSPNKIEKYIDKEIFVYFRSGRRSEIATRYLNEQGFRAFNLTGGFLAWEKMLSQIN